ncbi:helix-turn-helix domain-containing protein [Amycolatopsis rhabdoformis]|uniref:Helix-turn-helix domain-containing protein n=1 Tax=Amycolatopsis rhabdoformis TaxID=1448059 RepID=A0ABZ1IAW9_9PSEU|nr:helix-turn-helix domain-containing protein [Amycolatopsis rhabdoformis]WSE31606.1 helix-turn-helix domain-containing protein [Amycolatopsis rhabdoformis]
MKGLLLRLSAVDSDAEAAVRVIAYFDELVTRRATLPDLVRATASLAECVAGLRRGTEPALRFRPDGTRVVGAETGAAHEVSDGARRTVVPLAAAPERGEAGSPGPSAGSPVAASISAAPDHGEAGSPQPSAGSPTAAPSRAVAPDHGEAGSPQPSAGSPTAAPSRAAAPDDGELGTPEPSAGSPAAIPLAAAPQRRESASPETSAGSPAADPGAGGPRLVVADLGGETTGQVWLERDGEPGPLDDLVLERFAIAARVLGPAPEVRAPHLADPALVELVLGERAADEDRSRALVLLGLDAARPLRVVAVGTEDGRDPGAAAVALVARGGTALGARVAVVGEVAAVLLQPREGPATVVDSWENALSLRARERASSGTVRVGVGDAVAGLDARRSWLQARLAERFAVPATEPLVVHENLGSLTLLAQIPADHLRAQPDVRALAALAPADLETLEAFCRTGSLRQAAVALHRHHSSVATRLAHVEDALGWPLDDPAGRFRARLALLAYRLARRA